MEPFASGSLKAVPLNPTDTGVSMRRNGNNILYLQIKISDFKIFRALFYQYWPHLCPAQPYRIIPVYDFSNYFLALVSVNPAPRIIANQINKIYGTLTFFTNCLLIAYPIFYEHICEGMKRSQDSLSNYAFDEVNQ